MERMPHNVLMIEGVADAAGTVWSAEGLRGAAAAKPDQYEVVEVNHVLHGKRVALAMKRAPNHPVGIDA